MMNVILTKTANIKSILPIIHLRQQSSLKFFSSIASSQSPPQTESLPNIKLYQYEICPFCSKTKSLLSYLNIQPTIIEVNPLTKAELKSLPGNYKKVPIAVFDNTQQINGSDEIIETILNHPTVIQRIQSLEHSKSPSSSSSSFSQSDESKKWVSFANQELAPILYPNICRSILESYDAFNYVHRVKTFSMVQKYLIQGVGSFAMYFAASKIKAKRNITNERESLYDALKTFENEGLDYGNKLFTSGTSHPNLGDIAIFGTLHSIRGLKAHDDVIHSRGGITKSWYERMLNIVVKK